ncbi:MAG: tripartite tricarboxylate transporter substrate binding protein [Burkholderiaceae bacterium]
MPSSPNHTATPFTRRRWLTLAAFAALAKPGMVLAQGAFPTQPIRIIVPFGAGGLADITIRLVGQALSEKLGQAVIIDNKPGAGGIPAARATLLAPRDGHTLILFVNGTAISKTLFKTDFDPETDFTPISSMAYFDLLLLTAKGSAIGDVTQLLAESHKRSLNIGTINPGSTQNLSAELFKSVTKLDANLIPYKSTPEVVTALLRGDLDVVFESYTAVKGQIDAGNIRPIACTGPARTPWLPNVPTVRESGVADYEVTGWNALYAPAGVPAGVLQTLNKAMQETMQMPDIRKRILELGSEPRSSTPQEMAAVFNRDYRKWAQVIQRAGLKVQ